MKRQQYVILFVAIAVLLTAKVGFTVWKSSTDDVEYGTAAQQVASVPISAIQTATIADSRIQHQEQGIARVQRMIATKQKPKDSWAMLEAYLIPEAGAASDPQASGSVIEDETLTSLRQLRKRLDQRAKHLDQRSKSLQQAEDKLQQRITELEQLEASIQQRLADEGKIKNKKMKRLAAVYGGMKANSAAPVIAKMDLATVVKIFLLMDEKKVGKILSFLPLGKAVTISQALTRQISSVK